ncbi:hypothetical protein [Chitinimonas sp.]|uniref:hypothetical protein n=1 Tax=Chitinimonas sp. TaxID=1934313 RepID=UPI0035B4F331
MNVLSHENVFLLAGAGLSSTAAVLHVLIIFGGANWYRFFGAGEAMAKVAEAGSVYPGFITSGIALLLMLWSAYALAGAGLPVLSGLPLIKPALLVITAIYLLRGMAPLPLWLLAPRQLTPFWLWSSAICTIFGLVHLLGLLQIWRQN